LATGQQLRNAPGTLIGDPAAQSGNHNWHRTATLNWNHQLFKSADRALSLNVIASYGHNQAIQGLLDTTSEVNTRSPMGGFEFSSLNFGGFGSFAQEFFDNQDQIVK